ncbi:alkaline phosphatase [Calidifontibacter sp. DB0510]|uniref:Alkaline phosphatase n=1 Tax=Metallococcus carri TaxID=1656884 RepID=A0A967AYP6_9MICO|nr:alkaline phosphatase [Metallococcus carri]NHN54260.1 alkaline phosphatase [Metallococcus carri]NOP36900.1 alkaline phosphatase [Calidifontibacter sp. DB2511S]
MTANKRVSTRAKAVGAGVAALALIGTAAAGASPLASNGNGKGYGKGGQQPRNVILLIGDGMGDSEITSTRNYQVGANGRLNLDTLPSTGAYTTYALQKGTNVPDYVTDSAASGTGWATGTKTYNGAISVDTNGKPLPTILERAKAAGYNTGDVSTAEIQDATPAVLGSHVTSRDCKGPSATTAKCPSNAIENGGAGSISEQLMMTRPDVLLGGGKKYLDERVVAGKYAGQTVLDQGRAQGYQVATTAAEMQAAPLGKPLLGAFAPGNLDLEWTGPTPTRTGTPAQRCAVNAKRNPAQPHLSQMTRVALDRLNSLSRDGKGAKGRGGADKKGFFLQVEGASIDKQNHAANPCGQIGENVEFDKAVGLALNYQKQNPNTLVIVTGDHGHTSQIVPTGSTTAGYTATLTTADNAPMTISYATSDVLTGQEHTGTQIRVAAGGPQAGRVSGVTNQTDLFTTMSLALGL